MEPQRTWVTASWLPGACGYKKPKKKEKGRVWGEIVTRHDVLLYHAVSLRQPLRGPSLRCAPLRQALPMPRRYAASAGEARDRGSVASLPAPAPSRTSPAQALRPLWLRCERVIQEEITTGRTVSKDETLHWSTTVRLIVEKAYPSEPGLTTCWVCGCHRQDVRLMFCHAQPLERRPPDVPRRLRGALSR